MCFRTVLRRESTRGETIRSQDELHKRWLDYGSAHEEEAIDLLQDLGLKEYEAKCFAALTNSLRDRKRGERYRGTSPHPSLRGRSSPRIQGTRRNPTGNPQYFRAIEVNEAVVVLADHYSSRIDELDQALHDIQSQQESSEQSLTKSGRLQVLLQSQRVLRRWSTLRTRRCFSSWSDSMPTDGLYESLEEAAATGTEVLVGDSNRKPAKQSVTRYRKRRCFKLVSNGLRGLRRGQEASIGVL